MALAVAGARLSAELAQLARFGATSEGGVTRVLYSDEDLAARRYLRARIAEAGLSVREDALGNLFARWEGSEPGLAAVATGSHTDAIPHAGRYDGTVGVLGGLAALRALREAGLSPRRSVELIVFTAEEPTRFGLGCLGSRALAGALPPRALAELRDAEGATVLEAAQRAGFGGDPAAVALPAGHYRAFVELHIEQGPHLEAQGAPLGVVTGIAAPATLRATFTGEGGHAGAVLMRERRDALVAAALLVAEVERAALGSGREDTVATVGTLELHPGAVNSIPSRATLSVDVRDTEAAPRDAVVARVLAAARGLARSRGLALDTDLLNADPPAACDPAVVAAAEGAAARLGFPSTRLVSRAYHDALFMARVCPVGMLFIPSRGGLSHRPDEYSSPEDIARGALVLAHTLAELADAR